MKTRYHLINALMGCLRKVCVAQRLKKGIAQKRAVPLGWREFSNGEKHEQHRTTLDIRRYCANTLRVTAPSRGTIRDDASLPAVLNDARLGPTVRLLQSTGEVFVGMCSCWEFVEL